MALIFTRRLTQQTKNQIKITLLRYLMNFPIVLGLTYDPRGLGVELEAFAAVMTSLS